MQGMRFSQAHNKTTVHQPASSTTVVGHLVPADPWAPPSSCTPPSPRRSRSRLLRRFQRRARPMWPLSGARSWTRCTSREPYTSGRRTAAAPAPPRPPTARRRSPALRRPSLTVSHGWRRRGDQARVSRDGWFGCRFGSGRARGTWTPVHFGSCIWTWHGAPWDSGPRQRVVGAGALCGQLWWGLQFHCPDVAAKKNPIFLSNSKVISSRKQLIFISCLE